MQSSELWQQRPSLTPIELFVTGSIAGAAAKTVTAPLDRARLIYQVSPASFTFSAALRTIKTFADTAGTEGLWRGHAATLWRVMPFAGIQFSTYDATISYFTELEGDIHLPHLLPAKCGISGAIAAGTATLLTYPLDVLRTRMVAHIGMTPRYANYLAAVEDTLKQEGFHVFFRGLSPTLLGSVPYGALCFGSFAVLKQQLRITHGVRTDDEVPMYQRLAAGGLCGAFSQMIVHPLNVVRRRMQAERGAGLTGQMFDALDKDKSGYLSRSELRPLATKLGVPVDELMRGMDTNKSGRVDLAEFGRYTSTADALRRISLNEGMGGGLFKGASLTWVKGPVAVGLAFVFNDILKSIIHEHAAGHDGDQFAPLTGGGHHAAVAHGDTNAKKLKAIESLVCGGIAGSVAKTVIAPCDRIKILFQTDSGQKFTFRAALRTGSTIVWEEGVRGLWRGHGATLLRVMPYSGCSFATFDFYKAVLRQNLPDGSDVMVRFLGGAAAGTTATLITYPLDVFRARMAVHRGSSSAYNSYMHAFREIVRKEGISSLFGGARPTLLGIVPYSGLSFCMFETLKSKVQEINNEKKLQVHERLSCGAVSGLLAQTVTYPLDVVRRRMQVNPVQYQNEISAFRQIVGAEGIRGLFKGVTLNWVKGPVAISISFFVNDTLRDKVSVLKA